VKGKAAGDDLRNAVRSGDRNMIIFMSSIAYSASAFLTVTFFLLIPKFMAGFRFKTAGAGDVIIHVLFSIKM
jgi:fumarate reductase subunit C